MRKLFLLSGVRKGGERSTAGLWMHCPPSSSDPKVIVLHGTGKDAWNAYYGKTDVENRLTTIDVSALPGDWSERYRYTDFIDNMGDYYAATDLVVCRGGAGSLVEVCANGIASITIPKANFREIIRR